MVENVEFASGTSSTTRLAKNLSASVDMAEDAEIGKSDDGNDKTVKRLPFFKKLNILIGYLTFLYPKKR